MIPTQRFYAKMVISMDSFLPLSMITFIIILQTIISKNLDRNTLQHQGSYLLPLMHHFADANLAEIQSETDDVYFNLPFVKMVSYPFSWIYPMLVLAILIFVILILFGIKKQHAKSRWDRQGVLEPCWYHS